MTQHKLLPTVADTHDTERNSDKKSDVSARRNFLLAGGAAAAGVAVSAATMMRDQSPDIEAVAAPVEREGYHLSAHIKKYYETTLT
jgi:hypothetical protein